MKLKILLVPTLIALSIILIIWFIIPALSDEVGQTGVIQKYDKLKKEEGRVANLENKMKNTAKLTTEISVLNDKDMVYGYIPENKNEEEIVGNLSFLATNNNASIVDLSVSEVKESAGLSQQMDGMNNQSGSTAIGGQNSSSVALVAPTPKSKELEVKYSIIGKYPDIKMILEKINRLKRFNMVSSIEVEPLIRLDKSISDDLQVDMVLNFNYFNFKKDKQITDAETENKVFLSDKFNLAVMEEVKKNKDVEVVKVDSGEKGKPNPFLP